MINDTIIADMYLFNRRYVFIYLFLDPVHAREYLIYTTAARIMAGENWTEIGEDHPQVAVRPSVDNST